MWMDKIKSVDILVGMPCYNSEDTICCVVEQAGKGMAQYFPDHQRRICL